MARSNSGVLAKSAVLCSQKAVVKRVSVDNTGGSAAYLMLFDAAALPANGAEPAFERSVATVSLGEISFGEAGENFTSGLVAALSSTPAVLTLVGTDVGWFQATYY